MSDKFVLSKRLNAVGKAVVDLARLIDEMSLVSLKIAQEVSDVQKKLVELEARS